MLSTVCSDIFGERCLIGDRRWAGNYGVEADLVAYEDCSIVFLLESDLKVKLVDVASSSCCLLYHNTC